MVRKKLDSTTHFNYRQLHSHFLICSGSKLNDDPFDAAEGKPGMPDAVKNRIAALAEEKKKEWNAQSRL
jgi:hypothetical protein